MAQYKTPNVYVREESTLPASVAEVATAIPAFIGYTELTTDKKDDKKSLIAKPVRLTNIDEYIENFGGAYNESVSVDYNTNVSEFYIPDSEKNSLAKFFLYQAVQHFFNNGGGACYVVSTGGYTSEKLSSDFIKALDAVKQVDEVTLFVMPETVTLGDPDHYDIHNAALKQASELQDRFAIIDVLQQDLSDGDARSDALLMRNKVVGDLKYGATYYPYVRSSIARSYDEDLVTVSLKGLDTYVLHEGYSTVMMYGKTCVKVSDTIVTDSSGYALDASGERIQVPNKTAAQAPYGIFTDAGGTKYLTLYGYETQAGSNEIQDDSSPVALKIENTDIEATLSELNDPDYLYASTAKYNSVKSVLRQYYAVLPPSAAVAGCITATDNSRGVWKAPANVALTQVLEPLVTIDNSMQEALNVDEVAGKSINAIRTFVGKGTLIWGARTLAGNDLEWRYISVRRLFNMVEESLQKATAFAVFEPNTPITWLKLKTMTENYLRNLWEQGALMGTSESQAFFVQVGLGESMTEQDILEGLMKIKIGLAASRPAEFIELTFQHKSLDS